MFSTVAGRYDLMNDLMSGGLHRLWKDDLIAMLAPPKSARRFDLIDVAGGTGDITRARPATQADPAAARCCATSARRWWRWAASGWPMPDLAGRVAFAIGNAESLPFPDKSFDAYTIAFGIRNVTRIDAALAEAYRVLKTGGRFLCLEFSACEVPLLDRLYDFHSFQVIPRLGAARGRLGGVLPLPGGEHPQVSRNRSRSPDMIRGAGFGRVELPQPHRRHRRHPLGLADLSATPSSPTACGGAMQHHRIRGFGGVRRPSKQSERRQAPG